MVLRFRVLWCICRECSCEDYIGYGDKLQRRLTGLVSNVSVASDGSTLTVTCMDMMKLLNDFYNYNRIEYGNENEVWLASSVVQDLVNKAGMADWKKYK